MTPVANLTAQVQKCADEKFRNSDFEDERKIDYNCIIKDLKRKNILAPEIFEFNQTVDAENCDNLSFSVKNVIMEKYDECSSEVLETIVDWEQYFKLFAEFVGTPSDENNTINLNRFDDQMDLHLPLLCGFEKIFGSPLDRLWTYR